MLAVGIFQMDENHSVDVTPMKIPLLKTKLYVPATRLELIPRPHLIDRLNEGLSCRLTLMAAPAGYGKTTLLSAWAAECRCRIAWLSLDDSDNDPARFLIYLVGALQSIEAKLGQDILVSIQSPQPPTIEDGLHLLVNQLDNVTEPFVLVLDDYHWITSAKIHTALTFLLDHQPSQMHLVIATRKDPPLPLPRLRARGQLTELRQADLRFTIEETAAFLRRGMGIELSNEDVASLTSRTEGWIAGLQMAALSIRNRENVSRLIATFGGSHEYIVDYFAAEVLAQQPESIKTFLLQTSILDRLCGPLCDAVTGQARGQQTLEQLQQANLFVVPLDSERYWYRYHHLFSDLLRKQLPHEQPEILPELHRRASRWCEEHGLISEAIDHALSAHDEQRTSGLLDDHAEAFFLRGEHVTLLQWIAALPDDQRKMRPALGIFQAIMLSASGRNQEAELILQEVDQTLSNSADRTTWDRRLIGQAAAAHALIASLQDGPQTILFHARRALDLSPDEAAWRSSVLLARGNAYFLLGDLAACIQDLSEAIDRAKSLNIPILVLTAMPKLAQTFWVQARLNQAAQICQAGLQYIDQKGLARSPMSDSLFITWGSILCERNDLDRAAEFILRGLELSRSGHVILNQLFAYRSMMRVCMAKRNLPAAEEFLHQAETLIQEYDIPFQHKSQVIGLKAQLWIQQGRLAEAEHALQALDTQSEGEILFTHHGRLYLSYAQLRIAQGNLPDADKTLDRLFQFSQSSGQRRWVIPIQILRSILQLTRQDLSQALSALEVALEWAEPEGFIQDFLDEGEPMIRLLHEAVRCKVRPAFAHKLLARFPQDHPSAQPTGLVEPLSERELEVLRLVAEGLSNQEIAARLYLSLRTVKFHTGNVYGKLNVKSRTEAVSKARVLGLLSE